MCGRYALFGPQSRLREYFDLSECVDLAPRYNIAPQSDILVIRDHPSRGRVGVLHRWGLIPAWAKDAQIGAKLHNARAETVADKPAFRSAFRRLRCLIPASGFFEWQAAPAGAPAGKQPYFISPTRDAFLAMAGLVECWQPDATTRVLSVCVITTRANAVVAPIHTRMPVLLDPTAQAEWLDITHHDVAALQRLLAPAPADSLQAWPVTSRVNRASEAGEDLIAAIEPRP